MSVEAIVWAMQQTVKPSAAKFVLVALANCVNGDSFVAWPSVAALIEATCQDRKTVLANIARLRELGYIEDTGERKGQTAQVVVYRLKSPENGSVSGATKATKQARISSPKESQKRNGSESGTVPDFPSNSPVFPVEQSHISLETVPNQGHGTGKEPEEGTVREPEEREARDAPAQPRATRLPDGFPSDGELAWCREKRPDLDDGLTADKFRDYWAGVPGAKGRKLDWPATWRNFVRNEFSRGRSTPRRETTEEHNRRVFDAWLQQSDERRTIDA